MRALKNFSFFPYGCSVYFMFVNVNTISNITIIITTIIILLLLL